MRQAQAVPFRHAMGSDPGCRREPAVHRSRAGALAGGAAPDWSAAPRGQGSARRDRNRAGKEYREGRPPRCRWEQAPAVQSSASAGGCCCGLIGGRCTMARPGRLPEATAAAGGTTGSERRRMVRAAAGSPAEGVDGSGQREAGSAAGAPVTKVWNRRRGPRPGIGDRGPVPRGPPPAEQHRGGEQQGSPRGQRVPRGECRRRERRVREYREGRRRVRMPGPGAGTAGVGNRGQEQRRAGRVDGGVRSGGCSWCRNSRIRNHRHQP